jgi:hypothetical protein
MLFCPAVVARGRADLEWRSGLLFLPLLAVVVWRGGARSAVFGSGRWWFLSPELFEVVGASAARSPGLLWWRGGKVRWTNYLPRPVSTTPAYMVLFV